MLKILTPPVLSDNENTRKATVFHRLIWGFILILTISNCIDAILLPENIMRWVILFVVFNSVSILLLVLNKKGYTTLASKLFIVLCTVLIFGLAWTAGGIKAPIIQISPNIILITGLIVGWKQGLFMGIFITLCALALVIMGTLVYLPLNMVNQNPLSIWVNLTVNLSFIALLQYLSVAGLNKALIATQHELSLRKTTEEALRKSESLRRLVFENSHIPIVVMDGATFQYIDCNQAALEIYQLPSFEIINSLTPLHVSAPLQYDGTPSEEKVKFFIQKARVEGSIEFEWKHQRPNGEFWDAEVHLMDLRVNDRQLFQFTLLDITERKRAELALIESESRINSISNNFTAGMIYQAVVKNDGSRIFTYLSNSVRQLYGITPEQGMADSSLIYSKIHEDDINILVKAEEEAIRSFSTFKAEVRMRNPSGDIRWSSFVSKPFKLKDGTICWDGIEFIISDRKQVELALKNSEEKFSKAFKASPEAISIVSMDEGKYIEVNDVFLKTTGFARDEIIGKTSIELNIWNNWETRQKYIEALTTNRSLKDMEAQFRMRNGEIRDFIVSSEIIELEGKQCSLNFILDITERKIAEQKLRESEARFRTILENMPILLNAFDEQGNIIVWNKACEEVTGYRSDEIIGNPHAMELLYPDSEYRSMVWNSSLDLKDKNSAFDLVTKSGEKKTIEWFDIYHHLTIPGWASWGMGQDITERKQAEESLVESELRFKTLSSIANEGLMIHEQGVILDANLAFAKLFGYSNPTELIGRKGLEVIRLTPESKLILQANMRSHSDETYDIDLIDLNGSIIPAETRGKDMVYNGRNARLVFVRDITDRKKAELKLRDSEERYRKLVEAFPDMIMLSDLDRNIIFGNEVLERITGIGPSDYSNPNRVAHIHPDDQKLVSDAVAELLSTNRAHTDLIENRFIDSWGNLHWFSGSIAKIFLNDKLVLQTISRDITEKKATEKELENYRSRLESLVNERTEQLDKTIVELHSTNEILQQQKEELQKTINALSDAQFQLIQSEKMASLGVLSAGIAHEINNPLNFIHGGISGIENYFKEKNTDQFFEVHPLINAIHIGVKRASEIVTSLSHYSRRDDLPYVDCDIHAIIENCLIMLQAQLKNKVEVQKNFTQTPYNVLGSEGKLHQAILNIISNAEQSIEGRGTITIETELDKNWVNIFITDTGCGISRENILKIFDPFFTTKAPGKGTGLGLSITYNIIQEHKGSIDFESNLGFGTKAIIKLPVKLNS